MSTEVWTIANILDEAATQAWNLDRLTNGIYVAEGCIGLIGNAFVFLVIFTHTAMKKQLTNLLIINQSLIDLISSVVLIFNVIFADRGRPMPGVSGILLCRLWYSGFLLWASMVTSTFNLLAITIGRYCCIVYPILYKNKVTVGTFKKVCCAVWLAGFGSQVLIIVLPTDIDENGRCNVQYYWPSHDVQKAAGIGTILLTFVIPLIIMIFTYGKMIMVLKSRITTVEPEAVQQASHNNEQRLARASRNIFKTLIIVTVCFTICWIPNQIIFFCFNLGYTVNFTAWYFHLSVILVYLNCCCNPLIYVAQYEQFQAGIAKLKNRVFSRDSSTSSASATGHTPIN